MPTTQNTLVSLTNIPTPYRTHFYNKLAHTLKRKNVDLHVIYMAKTEAGRHWYFDEAECDYQYDFLVGSHLQLNKYIFHFNPSFVTKMWKWPPRWLLVSGSWFLPTVQLVPIAIKKTDTISLFWNESNLAYMEQKSGLISAWRSRTMEFYDGFVVPGLWAREYVMQFSPSAKNKPFIQLPNIVNEEIFRDSTAKLRNQITQLRQRWGCDVAGKKIFLTIARLEPIKGIRELVRALVGFKDINKIILLIAGNGSLQNELNAFIQEAGLQEHIRLVGYKEENEIVELFALADAFVLPSLGDPYPLAVIEAAFAGLPLLISDRVGCHVEALTPGVNGFLFNPYDPSNIIACIKGFLDLNSEEQKQMGAHSLTIANEIFSTDRVVSNFVTELINL